MTREEYMPLYKISNVIRHYTFFHLLPIKNQGARKKNRQSVMLRISVESVEPGAVLAKPIVNDAGITLIAAGVEVTELLRERLISMGIAEVFVIVRQVPDIPKEEFIAKVNATFTKTGGDPRMAAMKRALLAHIEELY